MVDKVEWYKVDNVMEEYLNLINGFRILSKYLY